MSHIIVTGGASGLGAAIADALLVAGHSVCRFDHKFGDDVLAPAGPPPEFEEKVDVLINCAGVNLIDWLELFEEADWDKVMDTNAKGIYKMAQHYLPFLRMSKGTILNIVSNAAHVPMTCSLAYNASKAAALMMTRQMARELTPKFGITVFSVSPNKLSGTGMSASIEEQVLKTRGWTKAYAEEYQRKALLTGEETPPALIAEFIAFLLSSKDRHRFLSGCDIPYGA